MKGSGKICLVLILFCLGLSMQANADDTDSVRHWSAKNSIISSAEQTSLSNWSAGGFSSFAFSNFYKGFFNFKKNKVQWDTGVELAYGMIWQNKTGNGFSDKENKFQKSDDKIEVNSVFSYKMYGNWNYSGLMNLKSQFDEGFKDDKLIAAPFSPIILTSSLGLEYKQKSFSLLLSVLTGKTTIVEDNRLAGNKIFGFEEEDQRALFSLGSYAKFLFQKDVFKNVNLIVKLDFYYDYNKSSLLDTDISTEVFVNMKINKYLTAFVSFQAIMDKDFNSTLQYKERMGFSIPINF